MFLLKLMVIDISSASDEGNSLLNASCQLFLRFLQSNPVSQYPKLFQTQCSTIRSNLMLDCVCCSTSSHFSITSLNEYSYLILMLNFSGLTRYLSYSFSGPREYTSSIPLRPSRTFDAKNGSSVTYTKQKYKMNIILIAEREKGDNLDKRCLPEKTQTRIQ